MCDVIGTASVISDFIISNQYFSSKPAFNLELENFGVYLLLLFTFEEKVDILFKSGPWLLRISVV